MSRIKLPVRVGPKTIYENRRRSVYDRNGATVFVADVAVARQVARALNAAPLTKAERAAVRAAIMWRALGALSIRPALEAAVDRVEAERAKAKKGRKP